MKKFLLIFTFTQIVYGAFASGSNLVANGDFEINDQSATQFNMENAAFSAALDGATAYGESNELDLANGIGEFPTPAAQSGEWMVGLHQSNGNPSFSDAFTLELSSALVSGMSYDLSFFGIGWGEFGGAPFGTIDIGLSTSAGTDGTLIFSGTIDSYVTWTEFSDSFVATDAFSFLSISVGSPNNGYAWVDNVSLTAAVVPLPAAMPLLLSGLLGLGALRRRRIAPG